MKKNGYKSFQYMKLIKHDLEKFADGEEGLHGKEFEAMKKLGWEGWELCAIDKEDGFKYYYFKREDE